MAIIKNSYFAKTTIKKEQRSKRVGNETEIQMPSKSGSELVFTNVGIWFQKKMYI